MGCFCMKEQARVDRPKQSKHFRQGVHPEQMFAFSLLPLPYYIF